MSTVTIWIDSEHAKIFKISAKETQQINISHHEVPPIGAHHDQFLDNAAEKFFHKIAKELKNADEILIMGPGLAKNHFKNHLDRHHHEGIAKKVVGVETIDKITDPQILAESRRYFAKHHIFETLVSME